MERILSPLLCVGNIKPFNNVPTAKVANSLQLVLHRTKSGSLTHCVVSWENKVPVPRELNFLCWTESTEVQRVREPDYIAPTLCNMSNSTALPVIPLHQVWSESKILIQILPVKLGISCSLLGVKGDKGAISRSTVGTRGREGEDRANIFLGKIKTNLYHNLINVSDQKGLLFTICHISC